MDPEIGAMSSQLVGHESTHLRASEVGEVVQGTTQDFPMRNPIKFWVAKTDLLTIPDGRKRKRKRIMLIENEPQCFPGN